jgi:hypothetical protein
MTGRNQREGKAATRRQLRARIIRHGECVFEHEWDSGGLGAGGGCEQVYRWRGKLAFASADYGNAGPFDSLEEVLKQQDCLLGVTSATESIFRRPAPGAASSCRRAWKGHLRPDPGRQLGSPKAVSKRTWRVDVFPPPLGGGS